MLSRHHLEPFSSVKAPSHSIFLVYHVLKTLVLCYNVDILTTFVFGECEGGCACMGDTAVKVLCVVFEDSVSGDVLGDGATMAWVTCRVLFDLLFTLSTAFKLDLDERWSVGRRICISFNSSCSSV